MAIEVRTPQPAELDSFYDLRWRVLRQPLGKEKGTEWSPDDENSYHFAAFNEKGEILSEGSGLLDNEKTFKVQYMATDPSYRKQGLGAQVLEALEAKAAELNTPNIVLDAREDVVGFYERQGYVNDGYSKTFAGIKHYRMSKVIDN